LAYASQQEASRNRGLGKAQKVQMRLGGSPDMSKAFPDKPRGMHWRTYERLRFAHDIAKARSILGLMKFVDRLQRRVRRPRRPVATGACGSPANASRQPYKS
jgi:hypothetical protein